VKRILWYKRAFLLLFGISTLVGLSFTGVELLASLTENRSSSFWAILGSNLFRAYTWGAFAPLVYLFAMRFVVNPRKIAWRPVASNVLFGIFLSLVYPWVTFAIAAAAHPSYLATVPARGVFISRQIVYGWYTIISLYAPTFLVVQALLFLRDYRREEAKNAALQAELSQAQLSALKMQLHPHFLFNSLHAISSLILVEPARANKMVALLGDFLRQTLDHSQEQMVTLEEELAFLRCYLDIEQTRFEDRLAVHFEVDEVLLDALVPHMIMQPLVENAVKHGIAPFAAPGRILVSAQRRGDELDLRVQDSGNNSPVVVASGAAPANGVGLANVRSRLDCLYGGAARLSGSIVPGGGYLVELTLPLRWDRSPETVRALS
jgi:two-component sensor histidine kinase